MGVIIHNGVNYTRKAYEPKKPALVSWTTGTNDEITAMVNAYYNGILSLDEIKSVWHLGDTRSVDLAAMEATGVGESHRAQTVELQILDFEHDDLTTTIGEKTKALITVDLKNCLRDATVSDTDGVHNTEQGYINATSTSKGGWGGCTRREWCNKVFYNSLPAYLKAIVKQVDKLTSAGNRSSAINTDSDYCFLLSEIEIYGSISYSFAGEGERYLLFDVDAGSVIKLPDYYPQYRSSMYWERSPVSMNDYQFCCVNAGTTKSYTSPKYALGIAPAFCL